MKPDEIPVLITLYNRVSPPVEVVTALRNIKPKLIYIAADGPNPERGIQDRNDCAETRKQVLAAIDWRAEVKTLFHDHNLGLFEAMTRAISWFFDQEKFGIILEDDCVASRDFFNFAGQLLKQYENDERVMHISGNCFLPDDMKPKSSYYFSQFPYIWGWATWARAWKLYEKTPETDEFLTAPYYATMIKDPFARNYYAKRLRAGKLITNRKFWSYQWLFALWKNHGIAINPTVNLVTNIGNDKAYATNTKGDSKFLRYPLQPLSLPLTPPILMTPRVDLDQFSFGFNSRMTLTRRITRYVRSLLQK